jgi:hypothetical protein
MLRFCLHMGAGDVLDLGAASHMPWPIKFLPLAFAGPSSQPLHRRLVQKLWASQSVSEQYLSHVVMDNF